MCQLKQYFYWNVFPGTTWLSQIVWLILNDCDIETSRKIPVNKRCHFLELSIGEHPNIDEVEKIVSPRLIKTHLPYKFFKQAHQQPAGGRFKTIVGLRNAKDAIVSFFHFYRMNTGFGNFDQGFDIFFEMFKAKQLMYGDYFDNVLSWWKERGNPNIYFVKYEDLKANPKEEIAKMAQYLGKSFKDDQLDLIVNECSFESMRKNPMTNYENIPSFDHSISKFIRKGEVGDWRNHFTEEQSQYVDSLCEEYLTPHGLEWSNI